MAGSRSIAGGLLAAALAVALGGCALPAEQTVPDSAPVQRVMIAGSGSVKPLVQLLADVWTQKAPGRVVEFLPSTHTAGGVSAVASGTADAGMTSRPLKDSEKALGLESRPLSDDGLVIATNRQAGATEITTEQVRAVYSGKLTRWRELGGADEQIVVLDRNEDESAKIILRQYVLGPKLRILPDAIILYYEGEMVNALEKTPFAIGYFSMGDAISNKRSVTLLKVDGVEPTVANVVARQYPIVRQLGLVFRQDIKPAPKSFVDFMLSEEGAKLMTDAGYAPARR